VDIIVADDDAITRARLCRHLEKHGHTVFTCNDGLQAYNTFSSRERQPEVLLTDWMMPAMDGVTLAKRIRQITTGKSYTYIILLTGKTELEDRIFGFIDGEVDDYIVKPFSFDELLVRINVGERVVRLERKLLAHTKSLECTVSLQTQQLRKTKDELIARLLSALDFRDQETGAHVNRIGLTSVMLAQQVGWNPLRSDDLRVAAAMHDIGKVGIPDGILLKEGKLTVEEFEVMKSHTLIGASILAGSEFDVIQTAHEIARSHHERWDGHGYPEGLSGEAIPLSARIVSIVDVFDALANDRIYRPALPIEEVLRIMLEGRDTHFDPRLLDIFLDSLPAAICIQEESR